MKQSVIQFRDVSKQYGDLEVLTNITLDVMHGEFLTLLGPSGCGKTTLLRLISGFEEPSSGQILIDGRDVTGLSPQERHVNTVFQSYALFPHMTVYENVAFGLRCMHVPRDEIDDRVKHALSMVKLAHLANRKPLQLSGGQQQRVAIARAVVNKPLVLLLDEPLSSLDYRLRKLMQLELKQLQATLGITFIFVTHDQEEALSMSDRVVVMQEGAIEQVGTPREVYEKPRTLKVATFIGEVNIFETTIQRADEKELEVELEGLSFQLKNRKNFQAGQSVSVLMRPEDFQVWEGKDLINESTAKMLVGTVEQVIYKGVTVDLIVKLASQKRISATQFFNEDDENLDYRVGETVYVEWKLGWEVLLLNEA